MTLDVVNATNHDGLGSAVERSFGAEGLAAGTVTSADATASGTQAPAPTDLTEMAGTNTPCVK